MEDCIAGKHIARAVDEGEEDGDHLGEIFFLTSRGGGKGERGEWEGGGGVGGCKGLKFPPPNPPPPPTKGGLSPSPHLKLTQCRMVFLEKGRNTLIERSVSIIFSN